MTSHDPNERRPEVGTAASATESGRVPEGVEGERKATAPLGAAGGAAAGFTAGMVTTGPVGAIVGAVVGAAGGAAAGAAGGKGTEGAEADVRARETATRTGATGAGSGDVNPDRGRGFVEPDMPGTASHQRAAYSDPIPQGDPDGIAGEGRQIPGREK